MSFIKEETQCYKCGDNACHLDNKRHLCDECFDKRLRFTHMIFERRWKAKMEENLYKIIKVKVL